MTDVSDAWVVEREDLAALPALLRARGHLVVGPVRRDGAIVLDEVRSLEDLPVGWTTEQEPGSVRLRRRGDEALFGFVVGAQSPKDRFHPAEQLLFTATRVRGEVEILPTPIDPPKLAIIAARSCDLAAMAVQDRVFLGGGTVDPIYESRRRDCFIVAVSCTESASTCFCTSMGTGPRAATGFDLALTELLGVGGHRFLVEVGGVAGREVLAGLCSRPASEADLEAARTAFERVEREMERSMDAQGARALLERNAESPVWEEIGERCLGCANCTMVCPTCFCTNVEDVTDLSGEQAERRRLWDSCFTFQFSHLSGGSVRTSTAARYRHWLTHKLAGWHDQFGESGCVGCGRCIAWCPVGIDLTEELARIQEREDERAAIGGSQ